MSQQVAAEQLPDVPSMLESGSEVRGVSPTLTIIGANLRAAMAKKGLTVNQLAVKAGVPVPTAQNWIRGRTFPKVDALQRVAGALGTSVRGIVVQKEQKV